jgi:hypothetical protein
MSHNIPFATYRTAIFSNKTAAYTSHMNAYARRLRELLSPEEHRRILKLRTPQRIQDYLDSLPINFELHGETYMSPRRTMRAKIAHCFEGALLAAAALAFYGQKPLLMDLRSAPHDEDHVVALFRQNGYWGAISKTNHPVLRYRDPVYASPRELALSYFHEYFTDAGLKTLREYSAPFDLSRYAPEKWLTAGEELYWLVDALDESRHFPLVPARNRRAIRHASKIERVQAAATEWSKDGTRARLHRG